MGLVVILQVISNSLQSVSNLILREECVNQSTNHTMFIRMLYTASFIGK